MLFVGGRSGERVTDGPGRREGRERREQCKLVKDISSEVYLFKLLLDLFLIFYYYYYYYIYIFDKSSNRYFVYINNFVIIKFSAVALP